MAVGLLGHTDLFGGWSGARVATPSSRVCHSAGCPRRVSAGQASRWGFVKHSGSGGRKLDRWRIVLLKNHHWPPPCDHIERAIPNSLIPSECPSPLQSGCPGTHPPDLWEMQPPTENPRKGSGSTNRCNPISQSGLLHPHHPQRRSSGNDTQGKECSMVPSHSQSAMKLHDLCHQ